MASKNSLLPSPVRRRIKDEVIKKVFGDALKRLTDNT
jgi:hypothetical protein